MKTFARENGLSLFFATIFLVTIVAQSFAGNQAYNAEQRSHGEPAASWWSYVTSSDFWGAVMENWQSEFLQFALFILATIWLVQKGSTESKKLDEVGLETDDQQRVGDAAGSSDAARGRVGRMPGSMVQMRNADFGMRN